MYAAKRSCVNRLAEARAICETLDHPGCGVAVDVYHVWWDPDLPIEIDRLGQAGRLMAFHVCDWRVETRNLLTDREIMGRGCIDIPAIRRQMHAAGFDGFEEVEIFSNEYWSMDQEEYLTLLLDALKLSRSV